MRFVAQTEGGSVTWFDGEVTGDERLVAAVQERVRSEVPVSFDYWGEREPGLDEAFTAYLTIGAVLSDVTGLPPTFDVVPDNPDGYEPEGVWPDVEPPTGIVAAAYRHLRNRLTS